MAKKKNKSEEIQLDSILKEKLTTLYVGFMMIVFCIYYQNAFFDIAQAKKSIYITGTLAFLLLMVLLSLYSLVRNFKQIKETGLDLVEILILALIVSWGIGMLIAVNKQEAFFGYLNKCTGLIMYLSGAVAIIYVARYLKWSVGLIWSFLFGTFIVYILQVLNRFNIDPLGMYERINDSQRATYISTLGHGNYNSAFNCLTIGLGMLFLYLCKEKISKIIYGILLFIGFMGSICCCADSVYLGIGVAFLVLFGYTCVHFEKWWDFVLQCAIWVGANIFLFILNMLGTSQGFWGIAEILLDIRIIAVELVLLVIFVAVVKFLHGTLEKNGRTISRIYLALIIVVIAIAVIMTVIVNVAKIDTGILSALYINDEWGSARGSIWKKILLLLKNSSASHLMFGYGFNMVKDALALVIGDTVNYVGEGIADAHNIVLNSLVTSGIIGTVLFGAVFGIIIVRAFKKLKDDENCLFVLVGIFAFLAQGLINGPQSITTPIVLTELGIFLHVVRSNCLGRKKDISEK